MPPATREASFGPREAVPLDGLSAEVGNVNEVLKGLFPPMNDEANEHVLEELKRVGAAYARVFTTDDGRAVLEHLADNTVRRPTFQAMPGVPLEQMAILGVQREGCNALFFFMMQMIATGRQQSPPQREGS